ncbi:sucrase/ferredoxin-like domain-containing protein [Rhizoctonia solani AG-1 IA]|uniref:Sucrase/ferredoxin-like domain-containing protein n=1 Tax=Thanatephorus cucumeris (strain AG1-IA) TaxID=983506 RepID=L8XA24_THACA|nr:sucrase/ferredoxin-like domain-containing protein [Rhizoctonia solani AG-1 IA]
MIKHAIQSTMFSALSLVRSPPQVEELGSKLDSAGVPYTLDPCRTCADPCDLGHEEWPNRFDVDLSSDMLGSVKPYGRQVVISTGKSDWVREVTEESNSLAEHLNNVHGKLVSSSTARPSKSEGAPAGVFTASDSTRLSVLNGSHREVGCAPKTHTVLVFPDYKLVKDVPATTEGASELWKAVLDPAVGIEGKPSGADPPTRNRLPQTTRQQMPYRCSRLGRWYVGFPENLDSILNGSTAFTTSLSNQGWDVHTQIDDPAEHGQPALEDLPEPRAENAKERLQALRKPESDFSQRVLILRNSHMGGHKFAGNVIIYFPSGNGVWYGRVSPHEVQAVVESTILGGKVLPALLRGGTFKRDGHLLMDW